MPSDHPMGTDAPRNPSGLRAGRGCQVTKILEGSSLGPLKNCVGRDACRIEASRLHDPVCHLDYKNSMLHNRAVDKKLVVN